MDIAKLSRKSRDMLAALISHFKQHPGNTSRIRFDKTARETGCFCVNSCPVNLGNVGIVGELIKKGYLTSSTDVYQEVDDNGVVTSMYFLKISPEVPGLYEDYLQKLEKRENLREKRVTVMIGSIIAALIAVAGAIVIAICIS